MNKIDSQMKNFLMASNVGFMTLICVTIFIGYTTIQFNRFVILPRKKSYAFISHISIILRVLEKAEVLNQ